VCFFSTFLQFETKFHVNALFVIRDLRHTSKHTFSQPQLTTDWLHWTSWNLSHTVTKVQRAAFHIEDSCPSVGSYSAAAFTVVFITPRIWNLDPLHNRSKVWSYLIIQQWEAGSQTKELTAECRQWHNEQFCHHPTGLYRMGQKPLDDLNLAPCRHLCRWCSETHIAG